MLDNTVVAQLVQENPLCRFLVKRLEEAYQEGGEAALVEKLNMYGLNSDDPVERQSAQVLARAWGMGIKTE